MRPPLLILCLCGCQWCTASALSHHFTLSAPSSSFRCGTRAVLMRSPAFSSYMFIPTAHSIVVQRSWRCIAINIFKLQYFSLIAFHDKFISVKLLIINVRNKGYCHYGSTVAGEKCVHVWRKVIITVTWILIFLQNAIMPIFIHINNNK